MTPALSASRSSLAFLADQPAIDLVELLDKVLDAGVVEAHPLDSLDDLRLELVVAALGRPRQRRALMQGGDSLVLELVQLLVDFGDGVERSRARSASAALPSPRARSSFPRLRLLVASSTLDLGKASSFVASGLVTVLGELARRSP